jgi:HEAT repeat protein
VAAIIKILGSRLVTLLGAGEKEKLRSYMLAAMKDSDTDVQDTVVQGLAALKGPGAVESIFELALTFDPDRDHERLLLFLDCLGKIGFTPEVEKFMLEKGDLAVFIGVEVASRAPSREAVLFLQKIFWQQPRDLQRAVIIALAAQGISEDLDFFLDVLSRHEDGNVLKAALIFLGRRGDAAGVGEKVAALLSHPYDDVRDAALDACIALHDEAIVGYFLSMASSEDPMQRMMAAYALGAIDAQAFEHILLKSLDDSEAQVRKVALEALSRQCPLPPERLSRIEAMAGDPDSEVRLTVVSVLGGCDGPRFDVHLLKGLQDEDPWVRARCIENLGRRGVVGAVPELVGMLGDENQLVVIKAAEALGYIGGETAFRALLSLMDHENPDVQAAVEEAVDRIHSGEGA